MTDRVAGNPAANVSLSAPRGPIEDERIIAACRQGDPDGLRWLMEAYGPSVNGLLRKLIADPMTMEGVAHEAFLKAFRAMDRFKDGTNLRVWLLTIARNAAYDHLRKEKKERLQPVDLAEVPEPVEPRGGPVNSLAQKETGTRVREALDTLPPDERAVVYLRIYEELTWEAIGEALDIPEATARARMNRALERLKTRL